MGLCFWEVATSFCLLVCSQLRAAGFILIRDYKGTILVLILTGHQFNNKYFFCLAPPGKWGGVLQVRERGHIGPRHLRHPRVLCGAEQVDCEEGGIDLVRLQDHGAQRIDAFQPWQTPTAATQGPTHTSFNQGENICLSFKSTVMLASETICSWWW